MTPNLITSGRAKLPRKRREVQPGISGRPAKAPHSSQRHQDLFDLRFGRNNAVYKREGTGTANTGSFTSVMKVKELRSGKIFAAKVPRFKASDPASKVRMRWESLTAEFQKPVKLEHVGDSVK